MSIVRIGNLVRYRPDYDTPLPKKPKWKIKAFSMTDEEITAAALSDPDNPPLTDEEIDKFILLQKKQRIKRQTMMSARKRKR